jgi:hypothetical protein
MYVSIGKAVINIPIALDAFIVRDTVHCQYAAYSTCDERFFHSLVLYFHSLQQRLKPLYQPTMRFQTILYHDTVNSVLAVTSPISLQ